MATQAGKVQVFEEAARRQHRRLMSAVGKWHRSTWDPETLRSLAAHLVAEAERSEERFAVALGAAVKVLDKELTRRTTEAHNAEIVLPSESPFGGARYRLLGPPERPIERWLEGTSLESIPRGSGDQEIDLPAEWGLDWRIFPTGPNPYQIHVSFEALPCHVAAQLRQRVTARRLTVALISPVNGLEYDFQGFGDEYHPKKGTPYRFKGHRGDLDIAKGEVDAALKSCREREVDVLMYPELTFGGEMLGHLRDQLRWSGDARFPSMVIAGSFHEPASDAGAYVNRTRVFDSDGEEILRHDKLKDFRLTRSDIAAIPDDENEEDEIASRRRTKLCDCMGIDERGGFERIERGSELRIVDGPLGRMVTSICLDFCGRSIDSVAKRSRSNLFWVPAMSPSLKPFLERARELGTFCRATTIVANSEWLLHTSGLPEVHRKALRYLCYLPCLNPKVGKQNRRQFELISPDLSDDLPCLRVFRIGEILEALGGTLSIH